MDAGQLWPGWWQPVAELADQFRAQGCSILAQAEYDVPCWYQDVELFLFWLMAVPWPEEIDLDKHWQAINRVLEICQTRRGFETNEHRGLVDRSEDVNPPNHNLQYVKNGYKNAHLGIGGK